MSNDLKGLTTNYNFNLINFDANRWHTYEHDNWRLVDSLFASFGALQIKGTWKNSTVYIVGDKTLDADNGKIYSCLVTHTSPSTGSFAAARAANPTYWQEKNANVEASQVNFNPQAGQITTQTNVQNALTEIETFSKSLDTFTRARLQATQLLYSGGVGFGSVRVVSPGASANPGTLEFFSGDGLRRGYIGWQPSANRLGIISENGWRYNFSDKPEVAGIPVFTESGGTLTGPLNVNGQVTSQYDLIDNTAQYAGVSIRSRFTGGTAVSFVDGLSRNGFVDSSIQMQHQPDGSSNIVFFTQGAGAFTDRRANILSIFGDGGAYFNAYGASDLYLYLDQTVSGNNNKSGVVFRKAGNNRLIISIEGNPASQGQANYETFGTQAIHQFYNNSSLIFSLQSPISRLYTSLIVQNAADTQRAEIIPGRIEITDAVGNYSYIDFKNNTGEDFDFRLVGDSVNNIFAILGGQGVRFGNGINCVTGGQGTTNDVLIGSVTPAWKSIGQALVDSVGGGAIGSHLFCINTLGAVVANSIYNASDLRLSSTINNAGTVPAGSTYRALGTTTGANQATLFQRVT